MTYRELLDMVKKQPNCLWKEEQHRKMQDFKYKQWVGHRNRDHDSTVD